MSRFYTPYYEPVRAISQEVLFENIPLGSAFWFEGRMWRKCAEDSGYSLLLFDEKQFAKTEAVDVFSVASLSPPPP